MAISHGHAALESQLRRTFGLVGGNDDRRRAWCVISLTSLAALPSTVKSRSRTGKPPSISRMAPPVRYRLRPVAAAAALHLAHHPKLFPAQVAFQHEHVVAHSVLASFLALSVRTAAAVQARG